MSLASALQEDRGGHAEKAADLYEAAISGEAKPLIALLNLGLLYWQVTDYGYWTGQKLPQAFVTRAGTRFPEVLAIARQLYPQSTEVRFWEKYISCVDLGDVFSAEECASLLEEDTTVLTPAMHLFSLTKGERYGEEARELLRKCHEDGTAKALYVASVIEGVLKRRC